MSIAVVVDAGTSDEGFDRFVVGVGQIDGKPIFVCFFADFSYVEGGVAEATSFEAGETWYQRS